LLFPHGETTPSETVPDAWILTHATALILQGDIRAGQRALEWIKTPTHPSVTRLTAAIAAWERAMTFRERLNWRLGGAPPRKLTLDFPLGEV